MFSDHDVGLQFLKDVGLIPSGLCAVSSDHKCAGASNLVLMTVTDGHVSGPYLLPQAVIRPQLGKALVFIRLT